MTLQEFLVNNKLRYTKYFLLDDPQRKFRIDEHFANDLIKTDHPYNIRNGYNELFHKRSRFTKMIDIHKIKNKLEGYEIPILFFKDEIPCILTSDVITNYYGSNYNYEDNLNCQDLRDHKSNIIDEIINSCYYKISHLIINNYEELVLRLDKRRYYTMSLMSPIFPIFIPVSGEDLISSDIMKYLPTRRSIYGKVTDKNYYEYEYLMLPFKNMYNIFMKLYDKNYDIRIRNNYQKIPDISEILDIISKNTKDIHLNSRLDLISSNHTPEANTIKFILDCYYELLQMKNGYYIRRKITKDIINYLFDSNNEPSYKTIKIQNNFIMP